VAKSSDDWRISRRHFFFGALAAGAIPIGGFGSVPSLQRLGYKSFNEKLNIACIGAGGRAASDIAGVATENFVAFADPDSKRAAATFAKYPKQPKYKDFRRMLDKEGKNIDAVTIAIPDHMHATAAMTAMEMGKAVYCEKPLTHTPWEARMLTQAAARYGVATQMGNQGYSEDGTRIAAEIIWSGAIGNVTEVHAWTDRPLGYWPQGFDQIPPAEAVPDTLDWDVWQGVAAERPFTSGGAAYTEMLRTKYNLKDAYGFYQPFNWRGFLDFGCGPVGDMACHVLGAPNMALQLGAPLSVEMIEQEGKNALTYPSHTVTRFEFPARGNMPPVTVYWHDASTGPAYRPPGVAEDEWLVGGPGSFGRGGVRVPAPPPEAVQTSASSISPAEARNRAQLNGAIFIGDKGYLGTDTYGQHVRLIPEARNADYKLPPEVLTRAPEHHQDWIRAAKGGAPADSNFSISGPFTEWVLLATIAMRVPGKLLWDSANLRFTNNEEANRHVRPEFRKTWSQVWHGKKLESQT
jgi:predicted dehydrogenase